MLSRFGVPAGLVVLWFVTTTGGILKPYEFPSPSAVLAELTDLASRGELWTNLLASVERVGFGFALALALAILIGALVGSSRVAENAIEPTLQALRAVPSLAWVPLLLLWLGIGETAKIALVAIGAFFPIYIALVTGIHGVDRKLIEVARLLGLRGPALAARVLVPATLPTLLVGMRIGLTQAWLFLVAAELLGATKGVGFLLTDGQQTARTDEIFVAILLFAVCGKLSEVALRALERRAVGWADTVPA